MEALGKILIGLQANVNYHNVAMGQGQVGTLATECKKEIADMLIG